MLKKILPIFVLGLLINTISVTSVTAQTSDQNKTLNFVFTSDAHYGITRKLFRGEKNVSAQKVNRAMINAINTITTITLPIGNGVDANQKIAGVDYLIETGDISNRMEIPYQSATASWQQFASDYYGKLTLKAPSGNPTTILLAPGNHDISNAIGSYKTMQPKTDPTTMVNIYNLMMKPEIPLTNETYNYAIHKINYSLNISNIHFMFITLWPDSAERIWMEKDLKTVPESMPVILFTHDQPTAEASHFTNPIFPFKIVPNRKFENLLAEHYKETQSRMPKGFDTNIEQNGLITFLKAHKNIKAYFHGNSNWNEFYNYHGPDNDINLPVFRVDSPMKGKYSSKDETRLSFQLISIDPATQKLTVRECLWNTEPTNANKEIVFGDTKTISLKMNTVTNKE